MFKNVLAPKTLTNLISRLKYVSTCTSSGNLLKIELLAFSEDAIVVDNRQIIVLQQFTKEYTLFIQNLN